MNAGLPQFLLSMVSTVLLIMAFVILFGFWRGAPFLPTRRRRLESVLRLAPPKPGELWVDLGSGDGRVVITAALAGARAIGYELNPLLVWISRFSILLRDVQGRAEVRLGDLWKADVSQADVVFLYLIHYRMADMKAKLTAELKPGARIVSSEFTFEGWTPLAQDGAVYLYVR